MPGRPPLVGRRFGHVRIDSLIDRGGMGEVYRGFDEALERRVAVKAIRPEQRPHEQARHRFHREARLLSKLEHVNICRIYDLYEGDAETGDLLILELVEGRKLGDVLKRGLGFEQKLRIAEEISSALEAAHQLRIVHRDLKPGNVMIKASGRVKVLDFGLARSLDNPSDPPSSPAFRGLVNSGDSGDSDPPHDLDAQTNHKFMVGTLAFMSPEQAVGETLTEASDLYSFGLLLQWLFTEMSPYGEEVSRLDLLRRVLQGDTVPTRTPDPHLTLLIESLKRPNPEHRPTAEQCTQQLQAIAGKPIRRRFRRTLISVVMALILLASGVFWLNHQRVERREELTLAFTHEAKDVEWLMRIAHSLPLQELTAHQASIRRRMGSMHGLMQIAGGLGQGPGNFALGRGHLVLGEIGKADQYLAAAWAAQYRHPEVGFAFAMVRAKQYEDARAENALVADPTWRRYRQVWMENRFRRQALSYLRLAQGPGGGPSTFVEALIALFERRWGEAQQGLLQTRRREPWLYEASQWGGELEIYLALEHLEAGRWATAQESFSRAAEHFSEALKVGSSDARLHLSVCRLWNLALSCSLLPLGDGLPAFDWQPEELYAQAETSCQRSVRVDPQLTAARLESARSLGWLAMERASQGNLSEAQQLMSRAIQGMPDLSREESRAASLRWRSWAFGQIAVLKELEGADPIQNLFAAVEQAEHARTADPEDPAGLWLQVESLNRLADHLRDNGEDPRQAWDRIEDILRRALRQDRNLTAAYLDLGRLHRSRVLHDMELGLGPEAFLAAGRTAAAKAQNLEPENPQARDLLEDFDRIRAGLRGRLGQDLDDGDQEEELE